jgi:predicted nucleotidyltransferase
MNADDLDLPITVHDLRLILKSHGVLRASVFGSYARGDATRGSDLDLLVDYSPQVTLFDHLALRADLEDLTHGPVDVVSRRALSKYKQPYVEREKVEIL